MTTSSLVPTSSHLVLRRGSITSSPRPPLYRGRGRGRNGRVFALPDDHTNGTRFNSPTFSLFKAAFEGVQ